MSRAQRRAAQGSARSRRVAAKPTGGGRQIPWVPIAVVGAIALVVVGVVYLVLQAGGESSVNYAEAQAIEADQSTDLPGEWVNLPEIYGGAYGAEQPNDNAHIQSDVDYAEDQGLPPVGGHHWGASGCGTDPTNAPAFCGPPPWGIYRDPWDPESLVHAMEHGGVIVWYNTEDQATIDQLEEWANGKGDDHYFILTPFPEMDEDTVAITSWSRRLKMPVAEFNTDALDDFMSAHECRFDPEDICNKK
jgi:hypothetical protein